jgi:hypothetical protein
MVQWSVSPLRVPLHYAEVDGLVVGASRLQPLDQFRGTWNPAGSGRRLWAGCDRAWLKLRGPASRYNH